MAAWSEAYTCIRIRVDKNERKALVHMDLLFHHHCMACHVFVWKGNYNDFKGYVMERYCQGSWRSVKKS